MRVARVLVVHNRYRIEGGEERSVELQLRALRRAGVEHRAARAPLHRRRPRPRRRVAAPGRRPALGDRGRRPRARRQRGARAQHAAAGGPAGPGRGALGRRARGPAPAQPAPVLRDRAWPPATAVPAFAATAATRCPGWCSTAAARCPRPPPTPRRCRCTSRRCSRPSTASSRPAAGPPASWRAWARPPTASTCCPTTCPPRRSPTCSSADRAEYALVASRLSPEKGLEAADRGGGRDRRAAEGGRRGPRARAARAPRPRATGAGRRSSGGWTATRSPVCWPARERCCCRRATTSSRPTRCWRRWPPACPCSGPRWAACRS